MSGSRADIARELHRRAGAITITDEDRPAVVDAAERALVEHGRVYVRARQLVEVVRDRGTSDWLQRPDGAPVIVPLEYARLLELLAVAATWSKVGRGGRTEPCAPPAWLADMLSARGQWALPQLEAIADAPVFRADGTAHDAPGYDPQTRIIYEPCGETFPPVPRAPSQVDARAALAELLGPFDEFPFKAESDRAATAALVLSIVGRAAIDGPVPMFAVGAPTPGSGKGLLVDVAAIIATGRAAPKMVPTDDGDEWRKQLLALAIESPQITVIDNVEGAIGSPVLASALTTGEVTQRVLGQTKMVTATLRSVFALTGNNVTIRGDLPRRVVPIDLDPRREHPEDRTFQRPNLKEHVRANRPRLVVAALTVLRAYVVAGRPGHGKPPKGSYEAWDQLVRGALLWAGGVDPCGGEERIREAGDDDLERLRTLLAAWHAEFGDRPQALSSVILTAGHDGPLYDALAAYCRRGLDARELGNAFRRVLGRVASGLVLRRESARANTSKWRVEADGT